MAEYLLKFYMTVGTEISHFVQHFKSFLTKLF